MNFDIKSKEFWDADNLHKEVVRVFDVCHGCRVCYQLCPSFVKLFEVTDDVAGIFGGVEDLSDPQINSVVDLCYQCKICDPICPYTPPHELDIDFPRTLVRYQLVRKKAEGTTFAEWVFAHTDLVGTLSSFVAPIANWANRNPLLRTVLEEYLGVHRDRQLPEFHSETFSKWFRKQPRRSVLSGRAKGEKVAFFYTCMVNYNEPSIGKAAIKVFERNGIECSVPSQHCCGLPLIDAGLLDEARKKMKSNVETLSRKVREGYTIVAPSASCSYMLKHDYPAYVEGEAAKLVSQNTYDLAEYFMKLHEAGKLDTNFDAGGKQAGSQTPAKYRYHQPCHLMAQEIGYKSEELLRLLPGADVARLQCCSGHDGSWSAKKEYFEESMKVGDPLFKFMKEDDEACCVTDCPLAAVQIEQGTGRKAINPVVALAKAYGIDVNK
ncbi:MAG: anaerobic glycerol-3-phosphate dehydrogenase subunit C [Acidobacteria bacterium]|nr:anaerobic glycerol-3-phosphate dehydrogenase subunit C [Acidobacteriota bacterium]